MRYSRFLITALTVAMLLGVTASAASTEITFLHRTHTSEIEWAEEVISRFEQAHPGVKVTLVTSGAGVAYQEKVAVMTAAGQPPDVFTGYGDKLGFIVRGFAADVTELAERDKSELQTSGFFPGVWEAPVFQGRRYGVPLTITTQLVFYNQDLLQRQGLPLLPGSWDDTSWTWDRLMEYGKRLTVVDAAGRAEQLALTQATEAILPDVTWMFGGDWFEPEAYETGWVDRVTFTRPETVKAYHALVELYANYAAAGPSKGIAAWQGFAEGRIAMDWIGGWRMGAIQDTRKSGGMSFGLGIGPPPLAENRANTRWTNPLFMSSTSKAPEAAWEFIKFATSPRSQELWVAKTQLMPARRTASQAYIAALRDVFDVPTEVLASVIGGAVAHSRRSIEEAIFDLPLEIIRQTSTWINPILAGQSPVESTLESFEAYLNAYAQELRKR
ncbi:MAG: ABC transporter substrate-binding protein [Limnochordia bacterium]|jgi:multiple sugar transport system substrate-binding protein